MLVVPLPSRNEAAEDPTNRKGPPSRDPDCGCAVDEERGQGARSGDATDEERKAVVLGRKAHIGVDAASGLMHSVKATPGDKADVAHAGEVLQGKEVTVLGDSRGI